jgi:hypothetical protein
MILVKITVENPEELLNTSAYAAGALVRIERSATGGGVGFAEIGTVAIVAGTNLYTYYDQSAAVGSYYRTRYSNAGSTNLSEYGVEFQATTQYRGYCSIYDVKQRMGIDVSDTGDDEELLQHIDQAAGWLENRCGWAFLPDPVTGTVAYTFDGYDALLGGLILPVPRGVRSITTLKTTTVTGGTLATVPTTEYVLRPSLMHRSPGWPATEVWLSDVGATRFYPGLDNIEITGAFGWSAVPREIEAVALRLVVSNWRARSAGGGISVTVGLEGERTFERFLSLEDKRTLERYMVPLPMVA